MQCDQPPTVSCALKSLSRRRELVCPGVWPVSRPYMVTPRVERGARGSVERDARHASSGDKVACYLLDLGI